MRHLKNHLHFKEELIKNGIIDLQCWEIKALHASAGESCQICHYTEATEIRFYYLLVIQGGKGTFIETNANCRKYHFHLLFINNTNI